MESLTFSDASRIVLHRVLIRQYGAQNWLVMRWGGRSAVAIAQHARKAIDALDGRRVGEVREALRVEASPPNLDQLLRVLHGANLVRSVDGARVSRPEVTIGSLCHFVYRFMVAPKLARTAERLLPIDAIPTALSVINWLGNRERIRKQRQTALDHIATVFADCPKKAAEAQRAHLRYLTYTRMDLDALFLHDPRRVDRWLDRHIVIEGVEHLREAGASSRGAVVALCHMNRFALAPLVLVKHGFRVCVIGYSPMGSDAATSQRWYEQFMALPGHGRIESLPNFNIEQIRRVMELLRQGYLVVSLADAAPPPHDDVLRQRARFFGHRYSENATSELRVPLRRHKVSASNWLGWLAMRGGVSVVPTVMLPRGARASVLRFAAPLAAPTNGDPFQRAEAVTREFFTFWEHYVSRFPGEWFGWRTLHHWMPSIGEPLPQVEERITTAVGG